MNYITYLLAGQFRRMAFTSAGDARNPALVCVHGLTRNAHDFDRLAAALSDRFYVVAPDLPGRGASDWLAPAELYQPASYLTALSHLLAVLDRPVLWLGTSLGGICGMLLAATSGSPITRLVLNDIGPVVPAAALTRIGAYVTPPERFEDASALEAYLRSVQTGMAPMDDADWRHLAATSARVRPDFALAMHYDPGVAEPFKAAQSKDIDLTAVWRAIACPKLVIRGERSDVLTAETFAQMQVEGANGWIVPGAGHAPSLNDAATQAVIVEFLEGRRLSDTPQPA